MTSEERTKAVTEDTIARYAGSVDPDLIREIVAFVLARDARMQIDGETVRSQ